MRRGFSNHATNLSHRFGCGLGGFGLGFPPVTNWNVPPVVNVSVKFVVSPHCGSCWCNNEVNRHVHFESCRDRGSSD